MIVLDGLWNRFLSAALNDTEDEFLLYGLAGHEGPAGRGSGEQPEWLHGDDRASALPAEGPQVRRPPVLRGEHRRVQPRDRGMPDLARLLRLAGEPAPDQAEQLDAPSKKKSAQNYLPK